jgi:hypothetical protein
MKKINFSSNGISLGENQGSVSWEEVRGLYQSIFSKYPYILTTSGKKLPIDLPPAEQKEALLDFFRLWKEKSPYLAQKNAFDYCEPPGSGATLLFSISVLFCMFLAAVLYQETWSQKTCSNLLASEGIVQPAELIRFKKRQQGNLNVNLKFQTPDGLVVEGKRLTMKLYNRGETDPTQFSVIYPPSKPSCWVLSETFGENDLNWAKRRYMEAFNFLTATSFLIVGLWGAIFSIIRVRQKRPFVNEIAAALKISLS